MTSKGLNYLKDWNLDYEIAECERMYTKPKVCSESDFQKMMSCIDGAETPTISFQEDNDIGFVASTNHKMLIR